ncbi:hypothetical protein ABH945_003708 [Paraburkholderia sp. GAS333]|uniref:TniQ family protein n=1 Tax=Paraburkholderia sp. GAS333 TaxID=3156279 RepID=UPI003D25DE94
MSSWYESSFFFKLQIRDEEDIAGFFMNHASMRTSREHKDTRTGTKELSLRFPQNLAEVVESFPNELPGVEHVIDKHTRFKIYRAFMDELQAKEMYDYHLHGIPTAKLRSFGTQMLKLKRDIKFCPDCAEDDCANYGYSIWRRGHLMPGVLTCVTHQRMLVTFCEYCESKFGWLMPASQPTLRCLCGGALKSVARVGDIDVAKSIDIATMAEDLLRDAAPKRLTSENLSSAIGRQLGTGSLQDLRRRLRDALCSTVGEKAVEMMGVRETTLDRFIGRQANLRPVRNPIQNLAVIRALFGGWQGLKHAMDEIEPIEAKERSRRPFVRGEKSAEGLHRRKYVEHYRGLTTGEASALRDKHRRWLLNIIGQDPSVRRMDLAKFSGYWPAIRHLLGIDSEWFERTLPDRNALKSGRKSQQMRVAKQVAQVVAHIFERRDLAIKTRPMSRIAKRYLVSAVRGAYRSRGVTSHPDVEKALKDCIDTHESWRARVTRDIVERVRLLRSDGHRWSDESWWNARRKEAFFNNSSKAKRWLSQNK